MIISRVPFVEHVTMEYWEGTKVPELCIDVLWFTPLSLSLDHMVTVSLQYGYTCSTILSQLCCFITTDSKGRLSGIV